VYGWDLLLRGRELIMRHTIKIGTRRAFLITEVGQIAHGPSGTWKGFRAENEARWLYALGDSVRKKIKPGTIHIFEFTENHPHSLPLWVLID